MTVFIFSVVLLAVLGILIGILLGVAGKVFAVETDERVEKVRECLPGNNCGGCGYPGCDGLAEAIVAGDAPVNGCPVGGAPVAGKIAEILGVEAGSSEKQVAFVKCAGTCDVAANKWTAAVQRWYRDVVKRHVHMAVLVSAPVWKSVSLMHYPFRMELLK